MTAKEKAKELTFKYKNLVPIWDCYNDSELTIKYRLPSMKECALIAVDEILGLMLLSQAEINYWWEVKQEIKKL